MLDKKSEMREEHFDQWKKLFFATLDENFEGEKVENAKKRSTLMADLMLHKVERSRDKHFIQ